MGLVNTMTTEGFSEKRPLPCLNNHVFWSQQFLKEICMKRLFFFVFFLSKYLKLKLHPENAIKFLQNVFAFLDNCN